MITTEKARIKAALTSNPGLVALIGKDRDGNVKVYQGEAPYADDYPRITFFEVDNRDNAFADDKPIGSLIIPQIDVWSKGSTSSIAAEVDRTMKELGYTRSSAPDFFESDTKVHHKAMRYRNAFAEN